MGQDRKMGHVQSTKVYIFVLLGLFSLTVVTYLASLPDLGFFNDIVAVGIAACKASLVILFFMHGRFEGKITWAFIWYPLFLLGLLLGGLFLDYGSRTEGKMDSLGENVQSITVLKPKDKHHGDDHGAAGDHAEEGAHGTEQPHGDDAATEDHSAAESDEHGNDGDQGNASGNH